MTSDNCQKFKFFLSNMINVMVEHDIQNYHKKNFNNYDSYIDDKCFKELKDDIHKKYNNKLMFKNFHKKDNMIVVPNTGISIKKNLLLNNYYVITDLQLYF